MVALPRGVVNDALRRVGVGPRTLPRAEPVRRAAGGDRAIALTFDDGPSQWTEPILDLLVDYGIRATFFVIGEAIAGRGGTLRRMHAEGHEIGNHTMTHPRLDLVRRRVVRRELIEASPEIRRVVGEAPPVFRPPGFHHSWPVLEVAYECGFEQAILASVAFDDFRRTSALEIAGPLLDDVHPGAIVCLHDGRPPREPLAGAGGTPPSRQPAVDALAVVVPQVLAAGYSFATVTELLATPVVAAV